MRLTTAKADAQKKKRAESLARAFSIVGFAPCENRYGLQCMHWHTCHIEQTACPAYADYVSASANPSTDRVPLLSLMQAERRSKTTL